MAAAHIVMAPGFSMTTRTLVSAAVTASSRRSIISGMATTLMANTSSANSAPMPSQIARKPIFSGCTTWISMPRMSGITSEKNIAKLTSEARAQTRNTASSTSGDKPRLAMFSRQAVRVGARAQGSGRRQCGLWLCGKNDTNRGRKTTLPAAGLSVVRTGRRFLRNIGG